MPDMLNGPDGSDEALRRKFEDADKEIRERLASRLPATEAELIARHRYDPECLRHYLRTLGAERDAEGVWRVVAERPTKRRKAEAVTEPVRPSLAADAIRYLREGAEGPGVILPVEYCRALVARLEEAGL